MNLKISEGWVLFVSSDTKFMKTSVLSYILRESVCGSNVLVEWWLKKLYANTCLLVNSVGILSITFTNFPHAVWVSLCKRVHLSFSTKRAWAFIGIRITDHLLLLFFCSFVLLVLGRFKVFKFHVVSHLNTWNYCRNDEEMVETTRDPCPRGWTSLLMCLGHYEIKPHIYTRNL